MAKALKNCMLVVCVTFMIGLFVWLGLYGYKSIENSDGVWWAIALWIFLAISQALRSSSDDVRSGSKFDFGLLILNFALWLLLGIPFTLLTIGMLVGIKDLFVFIIQLPSTSSSNALSVGLVFILGITLFQVRQHFRYFYGLGEVIMGLTIAYFKYPFEFSIDYSLAAIAGSVYLVVRGFDNMQQGKLIDKLLIRIPFDKVNANLYQTKLKNKS
jgi:hypothetical protein